jgi:C4-dicarboxylate-specific signal transduction histidine kinase
MTTNTLLQNQLKRNIFLMIKDNGCGSRKENLKNTFNPKTGGLGIGLATAGNYSPCR